MVKYKDRNNTRRRRELDKGLEVIIEIDQQIVVIMKIVLILIRLGLVEGTHLDMNTINRNSNKTENWIMVRRNKDNDLVQDIRNSKHFNIIKEKTSLIKITGNYFIQNNKRKRLEKHNKQTHGAKEDDKINIGQENINERKNGGRSG